MRRSVGPTEKCRAARAKTAPVCNLYSAPNKRDMVARMFRVAHNRRCRRSYGHPDRDAACAKVRAVRPRALKAMDDLRYLQIKYALQLRDTPVDGMCRA